MYLINDHDGAHGADFGRGAARLGIQSIHTRSQAPQVNAVAERVVRTLRRECLDHLIVFDERHLLSVLQEFAAYYKEDRPDRTLALDTPLPSIRSPTGPSTVALSSRGLHHVYERAA